MAVPPTPENAPAARAGRLATAVRGSEGESLAASPRFQQGGTRPIGAFHFEVAHRVSAERRDRRLSGVLFYGSLRRLEPPGSDEVAKTASAPLRSRGAGSVPAPSLMRTPSPQQAVPTWSVRWSGGWAWAMVIKASSR